VLAVRLFGDGHVRLPYRVECLFLPYPW